MLRVFKHFERNEIDPLGRELLRELAIRGALAARVGIGARIAAWRQARHRARDRHVASARGPSLARGRNRALDHFRGAFAETRRFEDEARGRERIRADHVGARGDVIGLNRPQQVEVRERSRRAPCTGVERIAASAQLATGAAVEQQHAPRS